jgi:hypothetical protein
LNNKGIVQIYKYHPEDSLTIYGFSFLYFTIEYIKDYQRENLPYIWVDHRHKFDLFWKKLGFKNKSSPFLYVHILNWCFRFDKEISFIPYFKKQDFNIIL